MKQQLRIIQAFRESLLTTKYQLYLDELTGKKEQLESLLGIEEETEEPTGNKRKSRGRGGPAKKRRRRAEDRCIDLEENFDPVVLARKGHWLLHYNY